MNECSAYVGVDVHKETIAVAVALPGREEPVYRGEVKNQSSRCCPARDHRPPEPPEAVVARLESAVEDVRQAIAGMRAGPHEAEHYERWAAAVLRTPKRPRPAWCRRRRRAYRGRTPAPKTALGPTLPAAPPGSRPCG